MQLASRIDHTLLRPDARATDILQICNEAKKYGFASVCVNSRWIPEVTHSLRGSKSFPVAVVGFPLGAMSTNAKVYEAAHAVEDGAQEIDMVLSIGDLKARDFNRVENDIRAITLRIHPIPVKVILEVGLLSFDEKIWACQIAQNAGAQFVKTCTGFATGEATVEDVQLMRNIVGPHMGVKASGGIRSTQKALALLAAGAVRLGTSSGVALVTNSVSTHRNY